MGTQYHMARYAYLYESTILADATAVAPALPQDCKLISSIKFQRTAVLKIRGDFRSYRSASDRGDY
jgi:hypothetical protein